MEKQTQEPLLSDTHEMPGRGKPWRQKVAEPLPQAGSCGVGAEGREVSLGVIEIF